MSVQILGNVHPAPYFNWRASIFQLNCNHDNIFAVQET